MGGWEGGRHGGGAYEPSLEVLIRLGLGERCRCGERVCQRPETPSHPPLSYFLHPRLLETHIPEIKQQVERKRRKGKS